MQKHACLLSSWQSEQTLLHLVQEELVRRHKRSYRSQPSQLQEAKRSVRIKNSQQSTVSMTKCKKIHIKNKIQLRLAKRLRPQEQPLHRRMIEMTSLLRQNYVPGKAYSSRESFR